MTFSFARSALLLLGVRSLALGLSVDANDDGTFTVSHNGYKVKNSFTGGSGVSHASFKTPMTVGVEAMTASDGASLRWTEVAEDILEIQVDDLQSLTGASLDFGSEGNMTFYGVWEYPWDGAIDNVDIEFKIKGLIGDQPGVNYANARAPFFFNSLGWGVYADESAMGTFKFTSNNTVDFQFETERTIKYYLLMKSDLKELLSTYAKLSNTISMPPDSGYGPIFWSDDMKVDFHGDVTNSEENYYDIADHLYYNEIRATGMFADRPYGTGNHSFGNFDFDPEYFPSPVEFIANLSAYGYDFQVWVANRAFLHTQLFNDSRSQDWLFPDVDPEQYLGPALNLSIPEAYDYFVKQLEVFPKMGIKGYKIDRGEEDEMPESEQNIQNILIDEICHKTMVDYWGEGNFFTFTRSAFDRSRSQVAIWNGDPQATFEGLQYSVASGIRSGLIGFSTWGSDIGGYLRSAAGDDEVENRPSEELWARWMQFGIFSPMYEIMVGTGHTPWYEPYTDRLIGVLKQTAEMHTHLIPFIKSYTYEATQTGLPVMRALFLEYPNDEFAYTAADMYAFGEEFLVAPFVAEGGVREVKFPGSGKFVEYYNKTKVYSGGWTEEIELELEYMPVYVREGAIVPTGDIYKGNAMWVENWEPRLEIEVFPSYAVGESRFQYYYVDEEGEGAVTEILMTTDEEAGTVTVEMGDLGGVNGELVVYHKGGEARMPLGGGEEGAVFVVEDLVSLFG